MKKPQDQWVTRRHRARRKPEHPGGAWRADARAEAFILQFNDGRCGRATVGLEHQDVDAASANDPDLVHAIRCWLAARGVRCTNLTDDRGRVLDRVRFTVADLGDGPELDFGATVSPGTPILEPQRVITLAPSNAEILAALDCFDRVIACEDSSDYPPAAYGCERLGPDLAPDLDRIEALRPDLVVSSLTVPGMERTVTGLRARGVPQVVLAPRSFAELLLELERLGHLLRRRDRSEIVKVDLLSERARLMNARVSPPVRVYLEWWPRPMFTPGVDCYSNELIDLAGGVNVFGIRPGSSVRIDAEALRHADPEVCFISWCGVAEDKLDPRNLIEREGLDALPAARAGRVYPLDERFAGRPGPRMLEASRRMAAAIAHSGVR
jgi:iron complex transport system substrate-binding protein